MPRTPRLKLKSIIVDWILPPEIAKKLKRAHRSLFQSHRARKEPDPLDEYRGEEWSLFRKALEGAKSYLEYGCGLSTEFVVNSYGCQVKSVDTSSEWVTRVKDRVGDGAQIIYVDLGPVGAWGRPLSYERRRDFVHYLEAGFDDGYSPEVVLVDGRFRVACFFTTLLSASSGTRIVFDDYPSRLHYKVVEDILSPNAINSRQALFVVPPSIDRKRVGELRDEFLNVME